MTLSSTDRALVRVCTAIALGDWDELRAAHGQAGAGEPDRAWREAVLQTHLFVGFPRLVEAYAVLEQVGGLGSPESEEEEPSERQRAARGRELFDRIYGSQAEIVRSSLQRYAPDFAHWIEAHAYGRVLARPGLDPKRREIFACACLAALGQEQQLASHARGALRLGASESELHDMLDIIAERIDKDHLLFAREILDRFASKR